MLVLFPKICLCLSGTTAYIVNIVIPSHHPFNPPGIKHFIRNTSIETPLPI